MLLHRIMPLSTNTTMGLIFRDYNNPLYYYIIYKPNIFKPENSTKYCITKGSILLDTF